MRKQRLLNQLFNLIKCSYWRDLLSSKQKGSASLLGYENLLIQGLMLSFPQLQNLKKVLAKIEHISNSLISHIEYECEECDPSDQDFAKFSGITRQVRKVEVSSESSVDSYSDGS
uniref:Uncharacterized protein n=1 Tax=Strombidium rassoulzadegani TaxID=1082188 RepID=A0A7S3CPZ0_9SPIT|mmetsp:Transcript_2907/g.4938  ORF Transcript_2907/g.4938 Transcript_2907/m.4938 type:complete len:115 (+) Transcript_2907:297-641(+)